MSFTPIDQITKTGIKTADGHHEEFDLIFCATGFRTSHIPSWKVEGREHVLLSEKW
jgi:cation diffusion facilitator CzcD-associated flavoprotein CzcO